MIYVPTPKEMAALDEVTIEEIGLPGAVLMENAGRAVAREVQRMVGAEGRVAVVTGAGNNGGDGYVVTRCLREWGIHATAYMAAPGENVRGDAAIHLKVLEQCGGHCSPIDDEASLTENAPHIETADVVVDCLFGTGLDRPVEGHFARVIEVMNRSLGARLAVDIPSGLSGQTGEVLGVAVKADRTVTIAFPKPGLVSAPGFARCGALTIAEIGIPRELAVAHGVTLALLERQDAVALQPPRSPLDHKGTRGHVLVVAGSPGKRGAARLTSRAALRAGAGLVTVAAAGGGGELPLPDEVMSEELDAEASGAIDRLRGLAEGKASIAMGPGMPTSDGGAALVYAALGSLELPLVLDADALNHLAGELGRVMDARARPILTPHPGEAARLLGCSAKEVQADRVAAGRALAAKTGAVVVLKGARTLVCDGSGADGLMTINPTGSHIMATAGAGDVLTGIIAAMAGQGLDPVSAARLGVYLHGLVGERLEASGAAVAVAGDLIDGLPAAVAALTE